MPIYEYVCSTCEHEFERIQKFSDPAVSDCPSCDAEGSVTKKLSASAFILSGGGWYSDGYSGKNGKPAATGGKSESKPESSSGNGGESKAATTTGTGASGGCAA